MQSNSIRGVISNCPTCKQPMIQTLIPDYLREKFNNKILTESMCFNCKGKKFKDYIEKRLKELEDSKSNEISGVELTEHLKENDNAK